ncbi:MAG: BACON domain-containing protein [Candidatus Cryptobacteroides sp.]
MKIFDKIAKYCVASLALFMFAGCQQDELVKPSALMCESSLTFDATGAEPQLLKVASDDDWFVDASEDWIAFTPASGSQTMEISVTVDDNYMEDGKTVARPRQGELLIANRRGYTIKCVIYQGGDNFLGAPQKTLSEVKEMQDGDVAKIAEAQVVATTAEGFVASDEGASMYVISKTRPSEGSKVFIAGEKKTIYGLAALEAGEIQVIEEGEPTRGTPVDFVTNLDPANASDVVYVSTLAGILGTTLYFEASLPVKVSVLEPNADIDLAKVNMHNIAIEAYYVGVEDGDVKLALVKVEDKGINEQLDAYFYEDFSWMKPLIDASGVGVGDSIGENNASADAPNLRSNGSLTPLLDELLKRGYEDLNPNSKVIYPQRYYWKFGKTSTETTNNNNGLILPEIAFKGDELVNAIIEFDWAAHMTGSGNIDNVQIVVEVPEGAGVFENGTNVSDPFFTTQEKGHIEWQHASVLLKGASNKSRITIRPYQYASVTPDQQRWHLDNIKVKDSGIPYSDPVYANVSLSEEVLTFEGTPAGPASFSIKSDNNWTLTKGLDSGWFDVDILEGPAGEEVTVTVTCQPSTSVNLRHGVIVLASADTRKNIHVVQSAAGGQLDPLISVTSDKNTSALLGEGDEFTVTVQSNIDYLVETSAEWITEVAVPSTKGLVEKSYHSFTLAPNVSGATRSGYVRFYNESNGVEAFVMVKQDNFEPRVDISAQHIYLGVPGIANTVNFDVDANVPFSITTDSDWITLPASEGQTGVYVVPVAFAANEGDARVGQVTISNESYSYKRTLTVRQYAGGVLFADDFSWLQPVVDKAKETEPEDYDTVGNKNLKAKASNIYSTASLKNLFEPLRDAIGYYIPGKADGANNVVYLQECYLKMGKTGSESQTSLTLPSFRNSGKDYEISFDWARMVQGDGKIDGYTLTLMITGNGTFENGTKYSEEFSTPQGTGEIFWTTFSALVKGADEDTRITMVATSNLDKDTGKINYTKSGGKRMFIDNIVVKAK